MLFCRQTRVLRIEFHKYKHLSYIWVITETARRAKQVLVTAIEMQVKVYTIYLGICFYSGSVGTVLKCVTFVHSLIWVSIEILQHVLQIIYNTSMIRIWFDNRPEDLLIKPRGFIAQKINVSDAFTISQS